MRLSSLILVSIATLGASACSELERVPLGEQHTSSGGRNPSAGGGTTSTTSTAVPRGGTTSTTTPTQLCDQLTQVCAREMRIKPYRVPCVGVALMSCLLVRSDEMDDYQYFYGGIEDFAFEWGYDYVGMVESSPVLDPPADGGSIAYRLAGPMQKTPVAPDTEFDLTLAPIVASATEFERVVSGNCTSGYTLFPNTFPKPLAFDAGMSCETFRAMMAAEIPNAIRLRFSSPDAPLSVVSVASTSLVTMEIKPYLEPCMGVGPMACMLARRNSTGEFGFFYDGIDGFAFEWGYDYQLIVKTSEVPNPPADGSSIAYTQVALTSKIPVVAGTEFEFVLAPAIATSDSLAQVLSGDCTSGYQLFQSTSLAFDGEISCASFRSALSAGVPARIGLRFSTPQGPLTVVSLTQ